MDRGLPIYESPSIVDHGSLSELTAATQIGGPQDGVLYAEGAPGHSCPTGGSSPDHCEGTGSEPGQGGAY